MHVNKNQDAKSNKIINFHYEKFKLIFNFHHLFQIKSTFFDDSTLNFSEKKMAILKKRDKSKVPQGLMNTRSKE